MEEILHHLAYTYIYIYLANNGDTLPTSTGERRISEPSLDMLSASNFDNFTGRSKFPIWPGSIAHDETGQM